MCLILTKGITLAKNVKKSITEIRTALQKDWRLEHKTYRLNGSEGVTFSDVSWLHEIGTECTNFNFESILISFNI